MNLVYDNRKEKLSTEAAKKEESVLKSWLMANTVPSVIKYAELEKENFKMPLKFKSINKNPFCFLSLMIKLIL
jgi:hypothetical protein